MENDLIYDVGMHNGNDTAFYLACGFRVLAIEADPALVAEGKGRFKAAIESGKLTILNVAIAQEAGTAEFWINEKRPALNSFSRSLTARDNEPHHAITIQCQRLDQIIAAHGVPFYLKIDIEGNDLVCCDQLAPGSKPEYISVEMTREELLFRLRDLGYDRFKLINQHTLEPVEALTLKGHVRLLRWLHRVANYKIDDRSLALRFTRGVAGKILVGATKRGHWESHPIFKSALVPEWDFSSQGLGTYSGSFGTDLPGKWLDWRQVALIWNREMREYAKMGKDFCCDLHATTSVRPKTSPTPECRQVPQAKT